MCVKSDKKAGYLVNCRSGRGQGLQRSYGAAQPLAPRQILLEVEGFRDEIFGKFGPVTTHQTFGRRLAGNIEPAPAVPSLRHWTEQENYTWGYGHRMRNTEESK